MVWYLLHCWCCPCHHHSPQTCVICPSSILPHPGIPETDSGNFQIQSRTSPCCEVSLKWVNITVQSSTSLQDKTAAADVAIFFVFFLKPFGWFSHQGSITNIKKDVLITNAFPYSTIFVYTNKFSYMSQGFVGFFFKSFSLWTCMVMFWPWGQIPLTDYVGKHLSLISIMINLYMTEYNGSQKNRCYQWYSSTRPLCRLTSS